MHPAFRLIASAALASQLAAISLTTMPAMAADAAPASGTAAAAPATRPVIAMQHTSWTAGEGAPTGVTGIAQTPDGWLWIGSASGLFRFDGVRFQRAPASLAPLSSNISKLGLLDDGTLWIVYRYGGASLLKDGKMRHFRVGEAGMPGGTPAALARDGRGRLWLAAPRSVRVLGARGSWEAPPASLGAPEGDVVTMLTARDGTLWVRTNIAVYGLAKDGARFERALDVKGFGKLAEDPDGNVWSSDMLGAGLYLVKGVAKGVDRGAAGPDPDTWRVQDRLSDFAFDRAGFVWQPGYSGAQRIAPRSGRSEFIDSEHGLSGQHGYTVFQDREGSIWIGTENGIDRFRDYRLHPLKLLRYIGSARPLAPRAAGGAWIDRSFLAAADAQPVQFAPESTVADLTTALHQAPDGTLWSGGMGGLWRVRADQNGGQRERVAQPAELQDPKTTVVFSMASDARGALWVSMGRRGLYTLQDGQWTRNGGVAELKGMAPVIVAADGKRIWFGAPDNGLAILEDGKVRRPGHAEGLQVGTVMAILPVRGGAWIGGENGLAWFDGKRFVSVVGRGGEPFAGINGIVFDAGGTLWLNGGAGLSAIAPGELQQAMRNVVHRVQFERLDYRDGLPGTASGITPLPSAIRSSDGKLWFSTMGGTVAFDPAALPRNRLAPPVVITALRADGAELAPADGLRLAPHTGTLEIDFTALSYRAPERMRFRYRLEGVDAAWQEPDRRRSAYYTNLAPGSYRFRVLASNDDGVWNEEGATLAFEVAPSLTQSAPFRIAIAAAFVLALWLLHRMRLRRVAKRVARRVTAQMTERLAERERIARELHDTVLQSIQGLVLKIGAAVQRLREDERKPLEDALAAASQVLGEGRDRVAGLRGESLGQAGLARAIAEYGAPLAHAGAEAVRFDVLTEGVPIELDKAVCGEVFSIVREAVWNAFVHAQPQAVTVRLRFGGEALSVTVSDDGRGIPPEVLGEGGRAGHWGIRGMRERAAGIGTLAVASAPGQGTTWTLAVPLQESIEA